MILIIIDISYKIYNKLRKTILILNYISNIFKRFKKLIVKSIRN